MPAPVHKVIITGTGRAGTTFLMQLLTELGLDTGYTSRTSGSDYFELCSAGMEKELLAEPSPYVVKNPKFCDTLPGFLATGRIVVDHVLVPIRELDSAALSRIRIGGADGNVPGGLIGTSNPEDQRRVLAEYFHKLMHTLAAYDIPHTLLYFPRVALDVDYAWAKLRFLMPAVGRPRFGEAFKRVARPDLIHHFDAASAKKSGEVAEQFLKAEHRKRSRRRLRRIAAFAAVVAALLLARLWAGHPEAATTGPLTKDVAPMASGSP
jgi:hypothetical protein